MKLSGQLKNLWVKLKFHFFPSFSLLFSRWKVSTFFSRTFGMHNTEDVKFNFCQLRNFSSWEHSSSCQNVLCWCCLENKIMIHIQQASCDANYEFNYAFDTSLFLLALTPLFYCKYTQLTANKACRCHRNSRNFFPSSRQPPLNLDCAPFFVSIYTLRIKRTLLQTCRGCNLKKVPCVSTTTSH